MCFFFLFRLFHISIYTEDFRNHNFSNFFRNVWVGIFFLLFLYRAFIDWVIYFIENTSVHFLSLFSVFDFYASVNIFTALPSKSISHKTCSFACLLDHPFFSIAHKTFVWSILMLLLLFYTSKVTILSLARRFFLYLNNLSNINYWWVFNTFVSFQAFVFLSTN